MSGMDLFGDGAELDHIGMAVKSLSELNLQGSGIHDPIQKVTVAFFRLHGVCIEAIEPAAEDSPISDQLAHGSKLLHLCFRVPDLEAAIRAGRAHGMLLVASPVPAVAFGGRKIAWIFSPGMGMFELLESPIAEREGVQPR
jgi:methylmalonyl-CoA/ethylmalonyl-CoA epimerase